MGTPPPETFSLPTPFTLLDRAGNAIQALSSIARFLERNCKAKIQSILKSHLWLFEICNGCYKNVEDNKKATNSNIVSTSRSRQSSSKQVPNAGGICHHHHGYNGNWYRIDIWFQMIDRFHCLQPWFVNTGFASYAFAHYCLC